MGAGELDATSILSPLLSGSAAGLTISLVHGEMVLSGRGGGTGGVSEDVALPARGSPARDVLTARPGLLPVAIVVAAAAAAVVPPPWWCLDVTEMGGNETVAWTASSSSSSSSSSSMPPRPSGRRWRRLLLLRGCSGGAGLCPRAGRAGTETEEEEDKEEEDRSTRWPRPSSSCISAEEATAGLHHIHVRQDEDDAGSTTGILRTN